MSIKYLVMDVDGTLTDGKIYIGSEGEVFKAFNVKDGFAINVLLKEKEIIPIIITGRKSQIVEQRCKELNITEIYQGVSDKLSLLKSIVPNLSEVAYIGDDIPDLSCMLAIKGANGFVGCPNDSCQKIIDVADYVCKNNGGNGAVREFIEALNN